MEIRHLVVACFVWRDRKLLKTSGFELNAIKIQIQSVIALFFILKDIVSAIKITSLNIHKA